MRSSQDTIAAIATPVGESGIGVIRISGANAVQIAKSIFQPAKSIDLNVVPSHTCYFGKLLKPSPPAPLPQYGEGSVIDQVVLTVFRSPHSYTGEDVIEISAHGNPFILNQILQAVIQKGARLAEPGEFTERAFLSGKMDLTQAEAVADLIRAKTDQSHAAALAQLEGHLAVKVGTLRNQLLPLLAHVEVGLDHSDEDHDFLSRKGLKRKLQALQAEIESLLASAGVGKILRDGLRVALVGRPNVGKSSLLNALLKEERAIVTPIPGTTRDTLEESVNWEGIPVILTDTAGIRDHSHDPVERLGIERTRKALQAADMVLCLFDASEPLGEEDKQLIGECEARPHILVGNKIDLEESLPPVPRQPLAGPAASKESVGRGPSPGGRGVKEAGVITLSHLKGEPACRQAGVAGAATQQAASPDVWRGRVRLASPTVYVSAKTGQGLPELVHAVKAFSLGGQNVSGEAHWLLNVRHQTALERAREALIHAADAAEKDAYEECVALELNTALASLGEIIGETATEDLLGEIFANFCIGK